MDTNRKLFRSSKYTQNTIHCCVTCSLAFKWSLCTVYTLYIIICIFVFMILISCSRKGVDDSNVYVVTPLNFRMLVVKLTAVFANTVNVMIL